MLMSLFAFFCLFGLYKYVLLAVYYPAHPVQILLPILIYISLPLVLYSQFTIALVSIYLVFCSVKLAAMT
jgi:hypothetical protein